MKTYIVTPGPKAPESVQASVPRGLTFTASRETPAVVQLTDDEVAALTGAGLEVKQTKAAKSDHPLADDAAETTTKKKSGKAAEKE